MNPHYSASQPLIIDRLQCINEPHRLTIEELGILLYELYSATTNILQGYVIHLDPLCNIVIRSRKLENPIIIYFHEALMWSIYTMTPLHTYEKTVDILNQCFGEKSELNQYCPTLPSTDQFIQLGIEAYQNYWLKPWDLSHSIPNIIP